MDEKFACITFTPFLAKILSHWRGGDKGPERAELRERGVEPWMNIQRARFSKKETMPGQ